MKNILPTKLNRQSGFTLLEVMVSLLIFATGMLGVAYQMSQGLKNTIDTEVHSSVMQIALQSIEPLKRAVLINNETLSTQLGILNTNVTAPPFAGNSNQQGFEISVKSANFIDINDGNSKSLFAVDPTNWVPPYTIVLEISYDTTNNETLSFTTTHVLAP